MIGSQREYTSLSPQALPEPLQQMTVSDFRGGLNTAKPVLSLGPNEFPELTNWLYDDRGNIVCRPGYEPFYINTSTNYFTPNFSGNAKDFIIKNDSFGYKVYVADGYDGNIDISYATDNDNSYRTLGSLSGYGGKCSILLYGNSNHEDLLLFFEDGTPKRWDHDTNNLVLTDMGLAAPTYDPNVELETAALTDDTERGIQFSGTYSYKLTYFYDDPITSKFGESEAGNFTYSKDVNTSRDADSHIAIPNKVTFSNLNQTVAPPKGVTRIYVYRSQPDKVTGPYKQIGYYEPDQVGNEFVDQTPLDEEGVETPIGFDAPVACVEATKIGSVILAFSAFLPNKLIWCNPGQVDVWPALNFAYLDGIGKKVIEFRGNIYIFTDEAIYIIREGNLASAPIKLTHVGCASGNSVVDVGNGLMWLGTDNVYWADFNSFNAQGDMPHRVGDSIVDKIKGLAPSRRDLACGAYHQDNYYLSVATGGLTRNDETIVFYLPARIWTSVDWAASLMGIDESFLYGVSSLRDPTDSSFPLLKHNPLLSHDRLSDSSSLSDIATTIRSKPELFGHEFSETIINSISLLVDGPSVNLTFSLAFPGRTNDYTTTLISSASAGELPNLIWTDEANDTDAENKYNTSQWFGVSTALDQIHKKLGRGLKGRSCTWKLVINNSGLVSVMGLSLYYRKLPPPS